MKFVVSAATDQILAMLERRIPFRYNMPAMVAVVALRSSFFVSADKAFASSSFMSLASFRESTWIMPNYLLPCSLDGSQRDASTWRRREASRVPGYLKSMFAPY